MTFSISMTTGERVKIGGTVFDKGKPPVPYVNIPEGSGIVYESSNPAVASIEEIDGDPTHVWVRSPGVGSCTITGRGTGIFANLPTDVGSCTITNAMPGQLNTTVGAPEEEPDEE